MSIISHMIRKSFGDGDKVRDAGLTAPDDVERHVDLLYGTSLKWQMLDVYRPKEKAGEKLPVIVSVHGGAWEYGDKELYQFYCMSLAQRGFAVVNFTYRLAPEFKYPAGLEDTNLVFRWVLKNAAEYGLDTDRIFAVGDSAGGHMLSAYACILTNPEYAKLYPFTTPEGLSLKAVGLNCGKFVMERDKKLITQMNLVLRDLMPHHGTLEECYMLTTLNHVTKDFPPAFIVTANEDFLKDQAPLMAEKLTELGVENEYRLYGDEEHPLQHVFFCNMREPMAAVCNEEECEFFRKHC